MENPTPLVRETEPPPRSAYDDSAGDSRHAQLVAPTTFRELIDRYQRGERQFAGSTLDEDPDQDCSALTLDGIDLSDSFVVATFASSSLRGSRFRRANVKTCDFRRCDLRDADFSGAALDGTSFAGAHLDGARFEGATIHGHSMGAQERPDW